MSLMLWIAGYVMVGGFTGGVYLVQGRSTRRLPGIETPVHIEALGTAIVLVLWPIFLPMWIGAGIVGYIEGRR